MSVNFNSTQNDTKISITGDVDIVAIWPNISDFCPSYALHLKCVNNTNRTQFLFIYLFIGFLLLQINFFGLFTSLDMFIYLLTYLGLDNK